VGACGVNTCVRKEENPFDYLTELDRHADGARQNPQNFLPWNYRQTLEGKRDAQTPREEDRQDE